jgi:response regulator of citrate/malate metabolism
MLAGGCEESFQILEKNYQIKKNHFRNRDKLTQEKIDPMSEYNKGNKG